MSESSAFLKAIIDTVPVHLSVIDRTGTICFVNREWKRFGQRPGDLSARYGGEEFALVLGNTPASGAKTVVKRALQAIAELRFPNEPSPTRPYVTLSVGIATIRPKKGSKPAELIAKADQLLYAAKERGRNQMVVDDGEGNP